MISVHLTEDLERFIHDTVRGGLYSNEGAVISDALIQLRKSTNTDVDPSSDESSLPTGPGKKLTKQGFQRHLVKIGLLDPLPETDASTGCSLELNDDEGDIVDEVVIRERLIEWLTGFLEK